MRHYEMQYHRIGLREFMRLSFAFPFRPILAPLAWASLKTGWIKWEQLVPRPGSVAEVTIAIGKLSAADVAGLEQVMSICATHGFSSEIIEYSPPEDEAAEANYVRLFARHCSGDFWICLAITRVGTEYKWNDYRITTSLESEEFIVTSNGRYIYDDPPSVDATYKFGLELNEGIKLHAARITTPGVSAVPIRGVQDMISQIDLLTKINDAAMLDRGVFVEMAVNDSSE